MRGGSTRPGRSFRGFETNEQVSHTDKFLGVEKGDVRVSIELVSQLFGIAQ